jgi:hypothetical protein
MEDVDSTMYQALVKTGHPIATSRAIFLLGGNATKSPARVPF